MSAAKRQFQDPDPDLLYNCNNNMKTRGFNKIHKLVLLLEPSKTPNVVSKDQSEIREQINFIVKSDPSMINKRLNNGYTPLMLIIDNIDDYSSGIVKYLLSLGADPNMTNDLDHNCLYLLINRYRSTNCHNICLDKERSLVFPIIELIISQTTSFLNSILYMSTVTYQKHQELFKEILSLIFDKIESRDEIEDYVVKVFESGVKYKPYLSPVFLHNLLLLVDSNKITIDLNNKCSKTKTITPPKGWVISSTDNPLIHNVLNMITLNKVSQSQDDRETIEGYKSLYGIIDLMIGMGADLNIPFTGGEPIFNYLWSYSTVHRMKIMNLMIGKPYNINVKDKDGDTFLIKGVKQGKMTLEILEKTIDSYPDLDLNIQDSSGLTLPMLIIERMEHYKEYLLHFIDIFVQVNVDFNITDINKDNILSLFIDSLIGIKRCNGEQFGSFFYPSFKMLINAGADINNTNGKGYTILDKILTNLYKTDKHSISKRIIKLLFKKGFLIELGKIHCLSSSLRRFYIEYNLHLYPQYQQYSEIKALIKDIKRYGSLYDKLKDVDKRLEIFEGVKDRENRATFFLQPDSNRIKLIDTKYKLEMGKLSSKEIDPQLKDYFNIQNPEEIDLLVSKIQKKDEDYGVVGIVETPESCKTEILKESDCKDKERILDQMVIKLHIYRYLYSGGMIRISDFPDDLCQYFNLDQYENHKMLVENEYVDETHGWYRNLRDIVDRYDRHQCKDDWDNSKLTLLKHPACLNCKWSMLPDNIIQTFNIGSDIDYKNVIDEILRSGSIDHEKNT